MTVRLLLFTDVVNSTDVVQRLGDAGAAQLWARHDRHARELLARHRGREIDRADGFFALFDAAADAGGYALAYHEALADLGIAARIGIHAGPVTLRENAVEDIARGAKPVEVEGLAKPLAARIMALAGGGQTLMSAAAEALLEGRAERAQVARHGHYSLKGIEEPVEIFELAALAAASWSAPADGDKAFRVVRDGDIWRPLREVRHNLPPERDAFIGRVEDLRALAARLEQGGRLITLVGPGGTGKTRLVRRHGWTRLGDWRGGVHFCDLSEARSLDAILFAAASTLAVPLGKDDPVAQLGHAIGGRGRCLVILDNFEQVVEHAAATVGRWLDLAPEAAFVVTSRERLHIAGEEIFPIEPLQLEHDAIELFATRARAQQPDFVLGPANRAAVAQVVRLLDGLPLAIELAAARVRVLSPVQLVERMRNRFQLLAGARGASARQATLRAAIDWSWELLAPWEQDALAQFSAFDGGFTLEAAEAVLDLARWPEAPASVDVVQALADKSLLRTWIPVEQSRYDIDEPYFGMYLSIHEYAAEKLAQHGDEARRRVEERHGCYFAGFGSDDALEALYRHGGVKRRRALALELDNLVAACRRAVVRGDGTIAVAVLRAIWEVLDLQGPAALAIDLSSQVLALEGLDASQRAAALLAHATPLRRAGRMEEAAARFEEALALSRETRNLFLEANALNVLGNLRRDQGRMEEARARLQAALEIARILGNARLEGNLLGNLGIVDAEQGRYAPARAYLEQALAIHRTVGNRRIEGIDTSNLGCLSLEQGFLAEAEAQFTQAMAIHREVGNRRDEATVVGNLGLLHDSRKEFAQAIERFDAALAMSREVGDRRAEGVLLGSLADALREQGRTEEALAQSERALAIDRAVGNRRAEGWVLASMGELLSRQGRLAEGRESLEAGEACLREIGDQLVLVTVSCMRARIELAAGEIDAARQALVAAESAVEVLATAPDAAVRQQLAAVRDALLRSDPAGSH